MPLDEGRMDRDQYVLTMPLSPPLLLTTVSRRETGHGRGGARRVASLPCDLSEDEWEVPQLYSLRYPQAEGSQLPPAARDDSPPPPRSWHRPSSELSYMSWSPERTWSTDGRQEGPSALPLNPPSPPGASVSSRTVGQRSNGRSRSEHPAGAAPDVSCAAGHGPHLSSGRAAGPLSHRLHVSALPRRFMQRTYSSHLVPQESLSSDSRRSPASLASGGSIRSLGEVARTPSVSTHAPPSPSPSLAASTWRSASVVSRSASVLDFPRRSGGHEIVTVSRPR